MRRPFLSLLLGLTLLTSAPALKAQEPTTEASGVDPEQTKRIAQEAADAFTAKAYKLALTRYQELYAQDPEPVFLYMTAECYRWMNQLGQAIAMYQLFLDKTPKGYPKRAYAAYFVEKLTEIKRSEEAAQNHKAPEKALTVLAGISGGAGLLFGGAALLDAKRLNDRSEFTSFSALQDAEIEELDTKRRRAAGLSDALLGVALFTGGAALLVHRARPKKTEASTRAALSLAPNGALLTLQHQRSPE